MLSALMWNLLHSEFGKHPTVLNVYNGIVTVRRGDGALVNSYVDIFFTKLYKNVLNTKWKEAVSLCRRAEVVYLMLYC